MAKKKASGKKVYRIGLIGLGMIAEFHAKAIAAMKGVEKCAECNVIMAKSPLFIRAAMSSAFSSEISG